MRQIRSVPAIGGVALAVAIAGFASAQTTSAPSSDQASPAGQERPSATADHDKMKSKHESGTTGTSATRPDAAALDQTPLRLRAFAVDPNTPTPGAGTGTLEIVIERWSTDAERDKLRGVLQQKGGGDALLRAVQGIKPRAGFVRTTRSLGWDIQFARQSTLANGVRRIVFGTDRPMSFWEASNRPRSADYEFLVGEIRISPDGRGEGRLAPAASVDYDEGTKTIEVENYEAMPVRLTDVRIVDQNRK